MTTTSDLSAVLYVSSADVAFTSVDLIDLASRAASANEGREVTGYLWFDGSMFVQYLEGPPAEVEAVLATISADDRHTIVKTFRRLYPADARRFVGWNMRLMNDVERFEMHLDGVVAALLAQADSGDGPPPASTWVLTDRLAELRA
ncbi:MAG: BLUF domain-containing protein [Actinomycetota bacterium]